MKQLLCAMSDTQPERPHSLRQGGFTLVELLVALTIFAVLAAVGWQVFGQLQQTRERVGIQAERLSELQQAYMQVERDITQLVNRPVESTSATDSSGLVGSFTLATQTISFTKAASIDPRLLKQSVLERITYVVEDDKLVRQTKKQIDSGSEQPLSLTLLDGVEKVKFVALDPGESNLWPSLDTNLSNTQGYSAANPNAVGTGNDNSNNQTNQASQQNSINPALTQLPMGMSLRFDYAGMPIEWRFTLPTPAPRIEPPAVAKNNGSGNPSQQQSQQSQQLQQVTGSTSSQETKPEFEGPDD